MSEAVTAEVRSTWAPTLELSPGDMAMAALYLHNINRRCPRPGPTIDQVSGFRFQRRDEATDPGVVSLLLPGLASVSVSSSSSQPSL